MKRSRPDRPQTDLVGAQQRIQQHVEADEKSKTSKASKQSKKSKSTADRAEPENPLPRQHQAKPGLESELRPAPRFLARGYAGSGKLKGKVALITGGDSGIGRAVAVLFAREGANVAIGYLSEQSDAHATRAQVKKEGRRCLLLPGDVRDPEYCRQAVQATLTKFGKIDVLVNNAAFQEHAANIEDITDAHFDMTLRTNIYGYFQMARAVIPHLPSGGAIVNTGSETGLFGNKDLLDYSATKGAIHAFTRALATQLLPRGIRVNAVAPGPVWTPLNPADKGGEDIATFGSSSGMQRPAQPEEISPAYVYLASSICSSYVTGVVLPVMGGVTPGG